MPISNTAYGCPERRLATWEDSLQQLLRDNSAETKCLFRDLDEVTNAVKMPNSRIEAIFKGIEAPILRELLNKLCSHGKFAIEDPMGKIEIVGHNIIISKRFIDLTGDNESDVEEEKKQTEDGSERGESSQEDEDDVPALTKQQLIASKERNLHIFKCENCQKEFDIHDNGKKDCWYHSGIKDVDHDSDFWADPDDAAHGDPQLFEDDPDFAAGFI